MRFRTVLVTMTLGIVACCAARACGPYFPYSYLIFGRERDVLKLPDTSFYKQLCNALNVRPASERAYRDSDGMRAHTLNADSGDLRAALESSGTTEDKTPAIVEAYRAARAAKDSATFDIDGLPREFAMYGAGAMQYNTGNIDAAIAKWTELLNLPAERRRYKSVWAAYMLGRAQLDHDNEKAKAAFEHARTLAVAGFPDSLDLAHESLGWLALIARNTGDAASAIALYAEQFKAGGDSAESAYVSLRMVCGSTFASPDTLAACAADEISRAVLTSWIVSRAKKSDAIQVWLAALFKNGGGADPAQADLLAWAAYNSGDFASAQKLLDMAGAPTARGQWVRCKLLLRDGKIDDAMAMMRDLSHTFPATPVSEGPLYTGFSQDGPQTTSVDAELGVLLLGRQEYVDAFDRLLHAGFWFDAAYVGDRVLTIDELRKYVDDHAGDPALARPLADAYYFYEDRGADGDNPQSKPSAAEIVRYMLARRLARANRWADALTYFPARFVDSAKRLSRARDTAHPDEPPKTEQNFWQWFIGEKPHVIIDRGRAEALYTAAAMTREDGMKLLGTEVQPDWHIVGGTFDLSGYPLRPKRWENADDPKFRNTNPPPVEALPDEVVRVLTASDDERRRVHYSAPDPDRRFHYRAVAADLMWRSAQLLPDNDAGTMRALYMGGEYLVSLGDFIGANRFYRSLVWRNLNMPYAQQADKKRWFPEDPPE